MLLLKKLLFYIFALIVASSCHSVGHGVIDVIDYKNVRWTDDIKVEASPSVLERSGDWVTVTITGVGTVREDDWVGVYTGQKPEAPKIAPVKYKMLKKYFHAGKGTMKFKLINMFDDYYFAYFTNGTEHPVVGALSKNTVRFAHPDEPMQGHLSLTGDPFRMKVSWATNYLALDQAVMWGTESKKYYYRADAESTTYTIKDMCGHPANGWGWRNPGMLWSAVMTDLQPSTRYYYVYGSDNVTGWSEEASFVTGPPIRANSGIKFAVYGDMGKGEVDKSREHLEQHESLVTVRNLLKKLNASEIHKVVHIGDISYAMGYASQWPEFMEEIKPVATKVPYMTCIGNHERDWPNSGSLESNTNSGGECGIPYEMRFPMEATSHKRQWYSYNYGNVHFVLMSTEHEFKVGSEQYHFLNEDLASVNRTATPWIVFGGHRPMYVSPDVGSTMLGAGVGASLREHIEPLFRKYRVDVAVWGHIHQYQRMCSLHEMKCVDDGTVHVVVGNAGIIHRYAPRPQEWLKFEDHEHWGFGQITTTETTLKFEYFRDATPSVVADSFELQRKGF